MNILLASVSFYPAEGPRAFRWKLLAEVFTANGHQVFVICAPPSGQKLEAFEWKGITIYPVGNSSLPDLLGLHKTPTGSSTQRSDGKKSRLQSLHDLFWKNIWWPDSSCLWYFAAKRLARQLVIRHQIDRIYTIALPFTSHLLGLYLHKCFPHLPWYADIGDPLSIIEASTPNNFRLYNTWNQGLEKKILSNATRSFVTTIALRDYYLQMVPGVSVSLVPPITNFKATTKNKPKLKNTGNIVRMAYFGKLIPKVRDPELAFNFLHFFVQSENTRDYFFELDLYGNIPTEMINKIKRYTTVKLHIAYKGRLPKATVAERAANYDVLVNFGNANIFQLPSKIVEYIALGLPILNFIQLPKDTSQSLLSTHPSCLQLELFNVNQWSVSAQKLTNFIEKNKGERVTESIRHQLLEAFLPQTVAKEYLK